MVAVGLSDNFAAQRKNKDWMISGGLVSRLGGLLGFRDLRNDDTVAALEREEPIRRFRQLASHRVLHRGDKPTPRSRPLSIYWARRTAVAYSSGIPPATCPGYQIGMAVENSYLIQQTSAAGGAARPERLRALSSTLNKEELLRKV